MKQNRGRESLATRDLSRREMLGLTAAATVAAALAGCAPGQSADQPGTTSAAQPGTTAQASSGTTTPSCMLTPELTEGPFYLDLERIRKDITEGKSGVPLQLRTTVLDTTNGCAPLENAAVDIWHCDALGEYSGFTGMAAVAPQPPEGGPPPGGLPPGGSPPPGGGPPPGARPTDDLTFLRGVQLTDSNGVAEFATIYPGWYAGRALHIHLKVHIGGSASGETYEGGHVAHTGQLFFPEDTNDQVATLDPYANHKIERVRNEEDGIFQQAGDGSIVTLTPLKEGSVEDAVTWPRSPSGRTPMPPPLPTADLVDLLPGLGDKRYEH